MLASTDYPAFYKVMVRAAKKQYKDGVLIAESKLSQGESKMADSKGGTKGSGGYDSDDDVDESQDLCMNNAMLEEFDDVSYEEKTFMMMWHSHLKSFRVYADLYIPYITERFARKHAPDLIRLGLRHNFLLHLITLWDYGVISSEEMENCILYVDKFALEGNLSPASPINSKFE